VRARRGRSPKCIRSRSDCAFAASCSNRRGQEHHVGRNFCQAAARKAQRARRARDRAAVDVPRRVGDAQAQLRAECERYVATVRSERRERPDRAAELQLTNLFARSLQTRTMLDERGQPKRAFVTQGDWKRLLQMRSAAHNVVAVAPGMLRQRLDRGGEIGVEQRERLSELENGRRVEDILRRRTPMDVSAGIGAGKLRKLLGQRNDRIADVLGCGDDRVDVEPVDVGSARDRLGRGMRDDPGIGFGAGQRDFDLEHRVQPAA
jgi:hypothetical protein